MPKVLLPIETKTIKCWLQFEDSHSISIREFHQRLHRRRWREDTNISNRARKFIYMLTTISKKTYQVRSFVTSAEIHQKTKKGKTCIIFPRIFYGCFIMFLYWRKKDICNMTSLAWSTVDGFAINSQVIFVDLESIVDMEVR